MPDSDVDRDLVVVTVSVDDNVRPGEIVIDFERDGVGVSDDVIDAENDLEALLVAVFEIVTESERLGDDDNDTLADTDDDSLGDLLRDTVRENVLVAVGTSVSDSDWLTLCDSDMDRLGLSTSIVGLWQTSPGVLS